MLSNISVSILDLTTNYMQTYTAYILHLQPLQLKTQAKEKLTEAEDSHLFAPLDKVSLSL